MNIMHIYRHFLNTSCNVSKRNTIECLHMNIVVLNNMYRYKDNLGTNYYKKIYLSIIRENLHILEQI